MARPKGNRKLARLTVSLDGQMFSDLRDMAEAADVSVAWLARRAIHDLIEHKQQVASWSERSLPPHIRSKKAAK